MKLGLVVGHTAQAPGAVRKDTGEAEFFWNKDLAEIALAESKKIQCGVEVEIFYRPAHLGYKAGLRYAYAGADEWGADATCELHFNSHHNPAATGTEVLTSGTAASARFAAFLQDEMLDALGLRDRGEKIVRRGGRGGFNLICGKAAATLIEPFFGSSPIGLAATNERHEKVALARAILRAAERAFPV
jgi:N-acetylmuramoyl-L-alanine amidase